MQVWAGTHLYTLMHRVPPLSVKSMGIPSLLPGTPHPLLEQLHSGAGQRGSDEVGLGI